MLKTVLVLSFAAALAPAVAQSASPAPAVVDTDSAEFKQKVEAERAKTPLLVTRETVGSDLSPEERKRLEELATAITDKSLQRYQDEGKRFEQSALQMKRRVDDIADEALAGQREKVLKFLGINPQANNALFYFVSFSMPIEMIRSYVLEAMWSGGTVVVRGVPKDHTLKQFLTEDLRQLIYGKGAAANISLDPRLFEAYDVKVVPAIVYTEDRSQLDCRGVETRTVKSPEGVDISYEACPPLEPSRFWKMAGAVTSDHALRSFIEKGAAGAKPFHDALRKGAAPGLVIPREQQAFKGEWKEAISPDDLMANKRAIDEAKRKQEAPAAPQ